MLIEKKLNWTEKNYGYLYWRAVNDKQIKEVLNNAKKIDVKIGEQTSFARQVDFNRRRIYIGPNIKSIDCDTVRISITSKHIDIKCKHIKTIK